MKTPRQYHGLEDARAEMPACTRNDGFYIEVSYNLDADEVYVTPHVDVGGWSRTEYANPRIIRVGNFARRVSSAKLKAYIDEAASYYE